MILKDRKKKQREIEGKKKDRSSVILKGIPFCLPMANTNPSKTGNTSSLKAK